jgi:alpha-glucosidase
VQNTGEMPGKPLRVLIAPANDSASTLYEDDGESLQYKDGGYMTRRFHQKQNKGSIVVDIAAPSGDYRPAARDLVLELWMDQEPKTVTAIDGKELPRLDTNGLATAPRGWSFENGMLTVKTPDKFEAARFTIQQ